MHLLIVPAGLQVVDLGRVTVDVAARKAEEEDERRRPLRRIDRPVDLLRLDGIECLQRIRDALLQRRLRLVQRGDGSDRRFGPAAELIAGARELARADDLGEEAAVARAVRNDLQRGLGRRRRAPGT